LNARFAFLDNPRPSSQPHLEFKFKTMKRLAVKTQILLSVLLIGSSAIAASDNATVINDPLPLTQTNGLTNPPDATSAYLEVQAQLHSTQLALERNQQEAEASATRAARDFADRLDKIEQSHTRDLQTAQSTNRAILIVAGTFAGLGFLAMLFTAYFQWRCLSRLTEIAVTAASHAPAWAMQPFDAGESQLAVEPPAESSTRLPGMIERLEKRIFQLEHMTGSPVHDATPPAEVSTPPTAAPPADHTARITLLLGKGQSLLSLDQTEEAIVSFDEVLALDQNNTEALVKKGVALERQRKLTEAIECYDRAIAADSSMTIAYLYKGGVYNRLERFDEALQCYEQALRAQENGNSAHTN
jgi:tetratricopeptide (TPR) repeat protein